MRRVIAALASAAAFIVLSASAATASSPYTVGAAAAQALGNGQHLALCESETNLGLGLLGGLLPTLSAGCKQIPVTPADANKSLEEVVKAMGGGTVAACSGDQNGLVNLQCTPLNL